MDLYAKLDEINRVPQPFEQTTATLLWTDEYVSIRMLEYHLDEEVDLSSRNRAFIERSAIWLAERFEIGPGTRVCDFGCGPGLYTSRLARLGAAVTGIDFSFRAIDYAKRAAREEGLNISYHLADYLEFEPEGPFDLITMIFCDYCALAPRARAGLLKKWAALLAPGGAVVFDVHSLNQFEAFNQKAVYQFYPGQGFWSAGPHFEFINSIKYEDSALFLDKYTIIEPHRERVIYNWLQCFSPEKLNRELTKAGLQAVETYDNLAGDPFTGRAMDMAVVAQRMDED